jgi:predicted ArsR family transcriptional regulator
VLLKRMKIDAQSFQKLVQTLVQQGDLVVESAKSAGRTGNVYRLATE